MFRKSVEFSLRVAASAAWRTSKRLRSRRDFVAQRGQAAANRKNPNAVYIWIPKTAGTSLNCILTACGGQTLLCVDDVKRHFANRGIVTFGHLSLMDLNRDHLVSDAFMETSWKFAYVRNPFDRAVSLFEYLRRVGTLPMATTFSIFCHYLRDEAYDAIGLYNHRGLNQLNPQVAWMTGDDGAILADFVGRFESFEADSRTVFEKLGVPDSMQRIERTNATERSHIGSYYGDAEVEIIQRAYRSDFESFHYSLTPYW
ncbi:MAG: sulfotransferase family 2 domain-containing protein [Planctomycetales bacterium]|nr:sulfotransferase family 2 domain-containing protein [Planctomycetales bacterium]